MPLTIVAKITAETGHEDLVRTALEKLVTPTRAEVGCIQYDLHADTTDPAVFLFFEVWETRDLWQDHLKSPHINAHGSATEGAIADVVINGMSRVA